MLTFSEIQDFKKLLKAKWTPDLERCGTISAEGEVLESTNLADDPSINFEFPEGDLEQAIASWHTHPVGDANLSLPDYWFFKSWSNIVHFIIYRDDVRCYVSLDGIMYSVDEEDDLPARAPAEAL